MRQRLFNRLAQRYLVRAGALNAVVGRPGPDLAKSTDWYLEEASTAGTFELFTNAALRRALRIVDGKPVLVDGGPATDGTGSWTIRPVGNTRNYWFVVSVDDPNLALTVDAAEHSDADRTLLLSRSRERDSMWLLGEDCVADARSIHLRYQTPRGTMLFYNEVYPELTPPGTFFCTSGFGANAAGADPSGYAGIQRRLDGSRRAIFSVWHRMADAERPVRSALSTVVSAHPSAEVTSFSGEGSGSSVRLPLEWRDDGAHVVRMCLVAEALGTDTVVTSYIARGNEGWVSLGAILRAETRGAVMSNHYAFIEDYARTGNTAGVAAADRSPYLLRSARFVNPWFAGVSKQMQPGRQAKVTAFGPHPLENLSAEPTSSAGFGVQVSTGATSARGEPPIGVSFEDPAPATRQEPNLSGIPWR